MKKYILLLTIIHHTAYLSTSEKKPLTVSNPILKAYTCAKNDVCREHRQEFNNLHVQQLYELKKIERAKHLHQRLYTAATYKQLEAKHIQQRDLLQSNYEREYAKLATRHHIPIHIADHIGYPPKPPSTVDRALLMMVVENEIIERALCIVEKNQEVIAILSKAKPPKIGNKHSTTSSQEQNFIFIDMRSLKDKVKKNITDPRDLLCFPKDSNPTAQEVQERFKQVSSLFKIERASEIESLELKNENTYVYKTVEKAYLELLNEVNPDSKKYEKINCFALRLESLKAIARKKQRYYQ